MQTIFPILRYNDARRAIRWLCDAFGFIELFSAPVSGEVVRHAQLQLGSNIIMLGTTRGEEGINSPLELGASTQALSVYIVDVDTHYAQARSVGAMIISSPESTDFGAREYHVRDLEGHLWVFSNFLPKAVENYTAVGHR